MKPAPRAVLATSIAGTAAALWSAAALAALERPPSQVATAVALAFLPYAGLLLWEPRLRSVRLAVALAALIGLPLVLAPSALSDDLYRYLWDGRVLRHGIDPYLYAPDDPVLRPLRDALWSRINNPELPTIYPPVAQLLFAAAGGIAHAPWSMKLAALLAHLGCIPIVARLAGERAPRAALVYALNPLALSESALGGHVDAVAALAIASAVLALVSRRGVRAAVLVALASGLKLVGLAVAPLVALAGKRPAVLAVLLALLPIVPLAVAGRGSEREGGLGEYARRWRGNDGGFAIVEAGVRAGLGAIGPLTGAGPGRIRIEPLARLDLRGGIRGEKKPPDDPAVLEIEFLSGLLARGIVVLLVIGLAILLVRRRAPPLLAARAVIFCGLLLAPQVHPWYLLWLLPLEVAAGRVAGIVWSAMVLCAYAPLDLWIRARVWEEPVLGRVMEYGVVLATLLVEEQAPVRSSPGFDPYLRES